MPWVGRRPMSNKILIFPDRTDSGWGERLSECGGAGLDAAVGLLRFLATLEKCELQDLVAVRRLVSFAIEKRQVAK